MIYYPTTRLQETPIPISPPISGHIIRTPAADGNVPPGISFRTVVPSIFVKHKCYFRKIAFSDILFIEAAGSYLLIYCISGTKMTLSFTLAEITPRLDPSVLLRVHRSFIVNIAYVDAFIGNTLCIGNHRIPMSRKHRETVLSRFNILGNPH